jgi:CHAT domain-containing protein
LKLFLSTLISPIQNGIHSGRIWWCPTGPFTYLPIHAAAKSTVFIHSYTSTLKALIQAQDKQEEAVNSGKNTITVTAVGVPEIPEKPHLCLPSVVSEINKITYVVGHGRIHTLLGKDATLENVSSHLPASTWLHLACHGKQDPAEPLQSGLLLYDKTLELKQILNHSLLNAEFVFLSACQTAMGDANLVNESMHLAGGLIFAGFQAAVGTLWNIRDSDGPKVAETVYQQLFANGRSPKVTETAEALHIAVQKLRDEGASFQQWIPFIHIGV